MKVIYIAYTSGPGIRHMCNVAHCISNFEVESLVVLPKRLSSHYRDIRSRQNVIYYDINWPKIAERHIKNDKTIIHLWTNRVFPAVLGLYAKLASPTTKIIVHLEDEEEWIFSFFRHKKGILKVLAGSFLPQVWLWWHPLWSNVVDNLADAFTVIVPSLSQKIKVDKPTHLLLPGIDLNKFNPYLKGDLARKQFDLKDKTLIMYCGTLAEYSDVDILIYAMYLLRDIKDIHLLLVGEGPNKHILEALCRKLRILNVTFTGRVPHTNIPYYLAASDVLVQPGRICTYNEYRLPAKIPEYMAMGRAVIIPNTGIGRHLQDCNDVLKTYTSQPKELAERIQLALEDENLRRKIARGSREKAEQMFDIHKNSTMLKGFYETLMHKS